MSCIPDLSVIRLANGNVDLKGSDELLSFLLEDALHCIVLIIDKGNSMLEDAQRIPGDQFKSLYDIFYWKIRLG